MAGKLNAFLYLDLVIQYFSELNRYLIDELDCRHGTAVCNDRSKLTTMETEFMSSGARERPEEAVILKLLTGYSDLLIHMRPTRRN